MERYFEQLKQTEPVRPPARKLRDLPPAWYIIIGAKRISFETKDGTQTQSYVLNLAFENETHEEVFVPITHFDREISRNKFSKKILNNGELHIIELDDPNINGFEKYVIGFRYFGKAKSQDGFEFHRFRIHKLSRLLE